MRTRKSHILVIRALQGLMECLKNPQHEIPGTMTIQINYCRQRLREVGGLS